MRGIHKGKISKLGWMIGLVYEPLSKDPTAKFERKVQQILAKYKLDIPAEVSKSLPHTTASLHTYMVSIKFTYQICR
jgi:hypothetical protein